jgi:hypothetical protein
MIWIKINNQVMNLTLVNLIVLDSNNKIITFQFNNDSSQAIRFESYKATEEYYNWILSKIDFTEKD